MGCGPSAVDYAEKRVAMEKKAAEIRRRVTEVGIKYYDSEFPAKHGSIGLAGPRAHTWRRLGTFDSRDGTSGGNLDVYDAREITIDDVSETQPFEGPTTNSAPAVAKALACATFMSPKHIETLLVVASKSQDSLYQVRLAEASGKADIITLDDQVPCDIDGHPMYMQVPRGLFFAPIIEKAMAKKRGSYTELNKLTMCEALSLIYGVHATEHLLPHMTSESELVTLKNTLRKSMENCNLVVASHAPKATRRMSITQSLVGVNPTRPYICMSIVDLPLPAGHAALADDQIGADHSVCLYQLRDPWAVKTATAESGVGNDSDDDGDGQDGSSSADITPEPPPPKKKERKANTNGGLDARKETSLARGWQGNWSKESVFWTPALRKRCEILEFDPSCIWMAQDDVVRFFHSFAVVKTKPSHLQTKRSAGNGLYDPQVAAAAAAEEEAEKLGASRRKSSRRGSVTTVQLARQLALEKKRKAEEEKRKNMVPRVRAESIVPGRAW